MTIMRATVQQLRIQTQSHDDRDVMARLSRKESAALATIYDRYSSRVLSFAKKAAGSSDAEDILQLTFERALKVASSWDARSNSALPWLLGIAARIMSERRRALSRLLAAAGKIFDAPTEHNADTSEVRSALNQLAPNKRLVLVMAEVEGFTGEEIAHELHIPVGTVWTWLHAARKEMRLLLEVES
jgi:RNA polymerase sigma factor (sigma-70 family)